MSNDPKTNQAFAPEPTPSEPDVPEPTDPAELARETFRLVKRVSRKQEAMSRQAAADRLQWQSLGMTFSSFRDATDNRFQALEGRVGTIETQIVAGVHADDSSGDLSMPPPPNLPIIVGGLSNLRGKMSTSDSIHALALQGVETAKQTPIIEETKNLVQQQLQAKKEGNARLIGIAVGALLIYLLQNFSLPHFTKGAAPAPAPAPALVAPAVLPPAPK